MRKSGLALFGLASIACSDPPPPPTTLAPPPVSEAPPPALPPEQPTWLYRVTTDTQPSYVFAALEYGSPLHESLPHDYAALFQFARIVVVVDARSQEEMSEAIVARLLDRSGSLASAIGPERLADLTDEIHDAIPSGVVRFLRPTPALGLFLVGLQADAYGGHLSDTRMSPTHDAVSRRRMREAPVSSLFDAHDVDRIMSSGSSGATEALRAAIDHMDQAREIARATLAAYRAGDEAALMSALLTDTPGTEAFGAAQRAAEQHALDAHFDTLQRELQAGNAFALLPAVEVLAEHACSPACARLASK